MLALHDNNNLTSQTQTDILPYFTEMPDESFVQMVAGNSHKTSPHIGLVALWRARQVCTAFNEKVDNCLKTFFEQVGQASFVIFPSLKTVDFNGLDARKTVRDLIIPNLSESKKWMHIDFDKWINTSPTLTETILPGSMEQCVGRMYNANTPALWVMSLPRNILRCVDLRTNRFYRLILKEEAEPVSYPCQPCMVCAGEWIAICSHNGFVSNKSKIFIIDMSIGDCTHSIPDMDPVRQMHYENGYLYVLCNTSENSKLLRYDCLNWEAPPKEIVLPNKFVVKFYFAENELLFVSSDRDRTQYEIFACQKSNCFENPNLSFLKIGTQSHYPNINITDDGFMTLTAAEDSTEEQPKAILERLSLLFGTSEITKESFSEIKKEYLQKFPVNVSKILDFLIFNDKIFMTKKALEGSVSCFDLKDGKLEKEFTSTVKRVCGTNFGPTLLQLPNSVEYLYSTSAPQTNMLATAAMKLDFSITNDKADES